MKNTQNQRNKLGKILAERLEKLAKEDQQKQLKKEIEDLEEQLKNNKDQTAKKREELDQVTHELEGLKKTFTLSWRDKKLLPGQLEREFIAEERDNRLYLPLQEVLEDDDELGINDYIYRWDTPDEVIEYVKDHEPEIIDSNAETIYYSDAIDYLKENDRTLTESLELAKNAGYDLDSLNSCVLATLLKTENEDYYWKFQDAIERLEEKAEELNEQRKENKDKTGLDMDEFIEQRAQNRAQRHAENDRTPEELKKIERLEQRHNELDEERKALSTQYWKIQEEQNKKKTELEKLEQPEDQSN